MRSPLRAIVCLRRSFTKVAPTSNCLDSVVETLSLPARLDLVLGFVQSSTWPLRFSAVSEHLPLLWSTWCAVYNRALLVRSAALPVFGASALVLSRPCLRHLLSMCRKQWCAMVLMT